jgi:hypothetical protein
MGGNFTEPGTLQGIAPGEYSIGQLALLAASGDVEFGWLVDASAYGDHYPHLFLALRAAGNPNHLCEIGVPKSAQQPGAFCPAGTYQQLSATFRPGMAVGGALKNGATPVLYHVNYHQGFWWFQYKASGWIGKVSEAYWSNLGDSFTAGSEASWFGEVESSDPCTPMGTGIYATQPGAAQVTKMFYEKPAGGKLTAAATITSATDSRYWGDSTPGPTFSSFRYGGPYDSPHNTCQEAGTWGTAVQVPASWQVLCGLS